MYHYQEILDCHHLFERSKNSGSSGKSQDKRDEYIKNLSMAYMQHKKAIDSLDVALEIARKLGDNRGQRIILKKWVTTIGA